MCSHGWPDSGSRCPGGPRDVAPVNRLDIYILRPVHKLRTACVAGNNVLLFNPGRSPLQLEPNLGTAACAILLALLFLALSTPTRTFGQG